MNYDKRKNSIDFSKIELEQYVKTARKVAIDHFADIENESTRREFESLLTAFDEMMERLGIWAKPPKISLELKLEQSGDTTFQMRVHKSIQHLPKKQVNQMAALLMEMIANELVKK